MPYFLVYVSSASTPFSRDELNEILVKSRANNARLNVSGMLVYKGGNLMQVLEGDQTVVQALYAKIGADRRHGGLMLLTDGFQPERQFRDWSMAFRDLNRAESQSGLGYSEFLNTPLTAPELTDPTVCQRLLASFKAAM